MSFDRQSNQIGFTPFVSHKRVRAAVVKVIYSPSCVGIEPHGMSVAYDPQGRPTPQVGWHVIAYEDGYISFCPPKAFEDGYTPDD